MTISNLKRGDQVTYRWGNGTQTGVIDSIDGGYIGVVWQAPDHTFYDAQIYACEILKRTAENFPVPLTQLRLDQLVALSDPETARRRMERAEAREELHRLAVAGQITGFSSMLDRPMLNPEWRS